MKNLTANKLHDHLAERADQLAREFYNRAEKRMTPARAAYRAKKIRGLVSFAECAINEWTRRSAASIAADPSADIAAAFYCRADGGIVWHYTAQPLDDMIRATAYGDHYVGAGRSTPIGDLFVRVLEAGAAAVEHAPRDIVIGDSGVLHCMESDRVLRPIYDQNLENHSVDWHGLPAAEMLQRLRADLRSIKWPYGATSYYYVTGDGQALSVAAVRENYREIREALKSDDRRSGWYIVGADVNFQDPDLYCDHTGARIPAEYEDRDHG